MIIFELGLVLEGKLSMSGMAKLERGAPWSELK